MLCSSSIQVLKSMQVNTTQVCKYVQVHKCTKKASMCRSEHSSMQRSSPTDWPGPAFAALSPGDHLPLRPTTQSHHNIINKHVRAYIYIHKYLPLIPLAAFMRFFSGVIFHMSPQSAYLYRCCADADFGVCVLIPSTPGL